MALREQVRTLADFQAFLEQPDNQGRLYEFIHGEISEVSPGRSRFSEYHDIIVQAVRNYCDAHDIPCHTASADGAFNIGGHVIAPDFAYKPTVMSDEYPDPVAPLWAVEIISPTDRPYDIRDKRLIYRKVGILLWEVYPESRSVDVYEPGKESRAFGMGEVLDAGTVLPGFQLSVAKIFR